MSTFADHRPSTVEQCHRNGWGPGTRLVGDEGYGPTVIEITAVGERMILAKTISRRGKVDPRPFETNWTLELRDWTEVAAEPSMTTARALDLSKPLQIRAEMAQRGILFSQLLPYDDPERGLVDPLDDDETKAAVRAFMGGLWLACLRAERGDTTNEARPA